MSYPLIRASIESGRVYPDWIQGAEYWCHGCHKFFKASGIGCIHCGSPWANRVVDPGKRVPFGLDGCPCVLCVKINQRYFDPVYADPEWSANV